MAGAGAGAQSYNSAGAGAGDEKPEFAQHYQYLGWLALDIKHGDEKN